MNQRFCLFLMVLAIGLLAAAPLQAAPFWGKPTSEELRRLKAGEVVLSSRVLPGSNVVEFTAMGTIEAEPRRICRFYLDPRNVNKYQDAIKEQQVLLSEPQRVRVRYVVGLPWPLGDRHFTIDIWEDPRESFVAWKLIDGNIRVNQGSYAMAPLGNGRTLVTYHVQADINTWIPPFLIAWAQGGMVPKVILKAREALEASASNRI